MVCCLINDAIVRPLGILIALIACMSRALVEFLGLDNMLAIICGSRSAAESIGIPPLYGALDRNKGLSGFARSHNLRIFGRYRVIALIDEARYKQTNSSLLLSVLYNQVQIAKSGFFQSIGVAINHLK